MIAITSLIQEGRVIDSLKSAGSTAAKVGTALGSGVALGAGFNWAKNNPKKIGNAIGAVGNAIGTVAKSEPVKAVSKWAGEIKDNIR